MDRTGFVYTVLPFVSLVVLGAGFTVLIRQRAAARRAEAERRLVEPSLSAPPRDARPSGAGSADGRPWWGSPWLWLGVCTVSVVLGIAVWPGLLAGAFLVLPFAWVSRPRRHTPMDPRANGHAKRGDPAG